MLFLFTTHETSDYSQSVYDFNNELTVQYFVYDEACSKSEFIYAISSQEQKADAEWYYLSENNINNVFETL